MDINKLQNISEEFKDTNKMPVLFLGHGSPMNAIEDNMFTKAFKNVSKNIQKPNAILCISAHWYTNGTYVTSGKTQKTIHDFYGFPKELYDVYYPVHGNPELAKETKEILKPNMVIESEDWGLDHGAWSVLKHLYPDAEIPVIQLSIDYTKAPEFHFNLAQKLEKLRHKGILIIGSGNIIHNLNMLNYQNFNTIGYGYDWALEAQEKTNNWLLNGDFKSLMDYKKQGTALQNAIPTPDHFLPLIYTLGLKSRTEELSLFNDELLAGSISMTSVLIG